MDAYDPFQSRLLRGERVRWSGRPKQGFLLTDRDLFLVPASIFFLGISLLWNSQASSTGTPWFFALIGWFILPVGAYFFAGRFLVDAWLRRDLQYAVTDKRVLIARPGPFARFTAIGLKPAPEMELKEHANRRGTIRFGPRQPLWANQQWSSWTPALEAQPQLLAIEKPREVFDLIQRATDE
jgi:hypothetical protein